MQRLILGCVLALVTQLALAASEHGPVLMDAKVDLGNQQALQRGARMFLNYCASCHSASYMRFNRIAADLGIPEDLMKDNLMFTSDKVGDTIQVAMRPADAEQWFGVAPPDLSVIARARGADWLYTFLQTYYVDGTKPTGVNNLAFPDTAMPHVLASLQGLQRAVYRTDTDAHGNNTPVLERLEPTVPGQLSAVEYQRAVRDLVSFLVYVGEPAKLVRYKLGFYVLGFLAIFLVAAYLLKREYWKDVH